MVQILYITGLSCVFIGILYLGVILRKAVKTSSLLTEYKDALLEIHSVAYQVVYAYIQTCVKDMKADGTFTIDVQNQVLHEVIDKVLIFISPKTTATLESRLGKNADLRSYTELIVETAVESVNSSKDTKE